jgi:hypothetical protein
LFTLFQEIPVLEEAIKIIEELKSTRTRFVVVHDVTVLSEDFLSLVSTPNKPRKLKSPKKSSKPKKKT